MVPEKNAGTAKKKATKSQTTKAGVKALKEKPEETLAVEAGEPQVLREPEAPLPPGKEQHPVTPSKPTAPFREGDDYTFLVRYDKATKLFAGEVAEIPECKTQGMSREEVLKELKIRLEDYIEDHRHQGGAPDPLFARAYPQHLNVPLSQSVFRKLDLLSRMEKINLDQLACELLASGIERRFESGGRSGQKNHQPNPSQQPRHSHHGGRHGGGGHNRSRHNQNLESRENFMEYVRNLEKGGNRWKK